MAAGKVSIRVLLLFAAVALVLPLPAAAVVPDGFNPTGSMSVPRAGDAAAPLRDGRVLVAGGTSNGSLALASTEIYSPFTGTFSAGANMGTARRVASACR